MLNIWMIFFKKQNYYNNKIIFRSFLKLMAKINLFLSELESIYT